MITVRLILLILACVAFVGAAIGVQSRINLVGLGLALWVLSLILG